MIFTKIPMIAPEDAPDTPAALDPQAMIDNEITVIEAKETIARVLGAVASILREGHGIGFVLAEDGERVDVFGIIEAEAEDKTEAKQ